MTTMLTEGASAPAITHAGPVQQPAASLIPADIAARLSSEQVVRLDQLLVTRQSVHAFEYRVSTRLFGRPFYVAILGGSERRALRRLRSEGQSRSFVAVLMELAIMALAASVVIVSLAMLTAGLVYGFHLITDGAW